MNLNVHAIRRAYQYLPLSEKPWRFSRKHFRIELLNGVFVKLNRFENRINSWELRRYLHKYAPRHHFSVYGGGVLVVLIAFDDVYELQRQYPWVKDVHRGYYQVRDELHD